MKMDNWKLGDAALFPGGAGRCALPARARHQRRSLLAWLLFFTCSAAQADFSSLVVFGDSLSDSGNNAAVFDAYGAQLPPAVGGPLPPGTLRTSVAEVVDNSFIPTLYPYASNRYSNGPVWAEYFAQAYGSGLTSIASLNGGTNFAYGAARVVPAVNPLTITAPSVKSQVEGYLTANQQAGTAIPVGALLVIEGGGNDARDSFSLAYADILNGIDPTPGIAQRAFAYALTVEGMVDALYSAGARNVIVWNTPDAGVAPAIRAAGVAAIGLATAVSQAMNEVLALRLADELAIGGARIFDSFTFIDGVVSNPGVYGLADASNACAAAANLAACEASNFQYLFWDGVHPTAAGHQLIANAMLALVPEPGTLLLLVVGLPGLVLARRRPA